MCICITSSIPSSLTTFTQWNDLQWKVAFLWGQLWVLHIPSCPLRGEGFEAFFSNLFLWFSRVFFSTSMIDVWSKQTENKIKDALLPNVWLLPTPPSPINKVALGAKRKKKVIFVLFLFLESCCRGPEAGTANHSCRLSSSRSHSQLYQSGESICWKSICFLLSWYPFAGLGILHERCLGSAESLENLPKDVLRH